MIYDKQKRDALHMHEVRILQEDLCQFSVKQNNRAVSEAMSGQQQFINEKRRTMCNVYGMANCYEYYDTSPGIFCFIL